MRSAPLSAAAFEQPTETHRSVAAAMAGGPLENRFAYIPPQCYTNTRAEGGSVANPCYVCHTNSPAPNYVDDLDLQQRLKLPPSAAANVWSNLFSPAIARGPSFTDDEMRAYVRASNYFDSAGEIALAKRLAALPPEWDGDGDGRWGGYVPDAWFHFDREGFDHRPDESRTGWRAFTYYPLPGAFFPTNGSASDALIRLDPALREDDSGHEDPLITALNLAIVEALITRRDVPIDPIDERRYGVDLDLDGALDRADRIRFIGAAEVTPMHYVGRAHAIEGQRFPIAPGLFPLGTEFLHSLRYLDVASDGSVTIAPRMKELRYAKKVRWFSYADLKAHADSEIVEQRESSNGGALDVLWEIDRGVYNKQGWLLQGFIEANDGSLRPQTREETAFCVGCHGGVGATTDSIFSFARKLAGPDRGYFHPNQRDLRGLPEPRRADGRFEYSLYLRENRAGDEFRDNGEIQQRFFDRRGALRGDRIEALHRDVSLLLSPSPERALALNRAYRAVVQEQSFKRGRDATLAPSQHVQARVTLLAETGITRPVPTSPLR